MANDADSTDSTDDAVSTVSACTFFSHLPQLRVNNALPRPNQPFAMRRAYAVPRARRLLQELERDASHDSQEVRSGCLPVLEVGSDAELVDHVGGGEGA